MGGVSLGEVSRTRAVERFDYLYTASAGLFDLISNPTSRSEAMGSTVPGGFRFQDAVPNLAQSLVQSCT